MKYNFFVILCIILLEVHSGISLRWKEFKGNRIKTRRILMSKNQKSNLDLSMGSITVVRDNPCDACVINFYCFVSGYNNQSELEFSFCKDSDCESMKDGEQRSGVNKRGCVVSYNAKSSINGDKGLNVSLKVVEEEDLSGYYFCKVIDKVQGYSLRTNDVELRDKVFWLSKVGRKNDNILRPEPDLKIYPRILPHTFKCDNLYIPPNIPHWGKYEITGLLSWSICPVKGGLDDLNKYMSKDLCINFAKGSCYGSSLQKNMCPVPVLRHKEWTTSIDANGDLIIYDISKDTSEINKFTYAIYCYGKMNIATEKPIKMIYQTMRSSSVLVFEKGIEFDRKGEKYTGPLRLKYPTEKKVVKMIPKNIKEENLNFISLYVLYQSARETKFEWRFNGEILGSTRDLKVTPREVQFVGDIKESLSGLYELKISAGTENIVAQYEVIILTPPYLIDPACMPPLIYTMESESVDVSCEFQGGPTVLKVYINSEEINLNQGGGNSQLDTTYPYLSGLDFKITPQKYEAPKNKTNFKQKLNYNVKDLRLAEGQTKFQDHTVTFWAENNNGKEIQSSSIYVIPKLLPQIKDFPYKYNCTGLKCVSTTKHTFKCRINLKHYSFKELEIQYYWAINNNRLDKVTPSNIYAKYFDMDPVTKDLVLNPIKSNNTEDDDNVKKYLADTNIECRFILKGYNFYYDSATDSTVKNLLLVRITLDYKPLDTAFIYWIIAIILALIVIIILIILLVRYCRANKGETYQLGKIEEKMGFEPEKEAKEEIFKPFQRDDNDAGTFPDRRMSMTDHSIGSANEGELDAYDLDPSNFNEDGSIIGQYTSDPRSRTEMI